MTCSYDYYEWDFNKISYCFYTLVNHYIIPLVIILYYYYHIVKAVVTHERALKEQAKKMNVDSLRSSGVRLFLIIFRFTFSLVPLNRETARPPSFRRTTRTRARRCACARSR